MAFSFTLCSWMPEIDIEDASVARQEVCIDVQGSTTATRNCGSYSTPPLISTTGNLFAREFDDPLSTDPADGTVTVNLGIWIGWDPEAECLWMGQEEAGICVTSPECGPQPTEADVRALAEHMAEELVAAYAEVTEAMVTVMVVLLVAAALSFIGAVVLGTVAAGTAA